MSTPAPLPPIRQDPSIVDGEALKKDFLAKLQAIRSNFNASNLGKARDITTLWNNTVQELSRLYGDLQGRQRARLEYLQQQMPYGPAIPDGTSPADTAVLHQLFRDLVEKARASLAGEGEDGRRVSRLEQLFRDAEAYGDELAQRAIFTVAHENRVSSVMKAYAQYHPDTAKAFDEISYLAAVLSGRQTEDMASAWTTKALATGPMGGMPQPDEVRALPQLEQMAAALKNSGVR